MKTKVACIIKDCKLQGRYFNCRTDSDGIKHWGLMCARHDNTLGIQNLTECGMPKDEAKKFNTILIREESEASR